MEDRRPDESEVDFFLRISALSEADGARRIQQAQERIMREGIKVETGSSIYPPDPPPIPGNIYRDKS